MNPLPLLKSALTLGLMFSLTACQPKPLTEQEQHTVTELTSKMQTHCVGRYLIDLPADTLNFGNATLQDVRIETQPMSQQEFLDGMHKREAELKAMKQMDGFPFLYGDREYGFLDTSTEKLRKEDIWHFIHVGTADADPGRRMIEAYKWSHSIRVKLQIEGSDFTRPDQTSDSIVQKMKIKNDVPGKLSQVLQLASAFRGRAEDEIPTEPGVCLIGGFIKGKAQDGEETGNQFVLSTHPNVSFGLGTDTDIHDSTTLLQRGDDINAALKETKGGRTVRKGEVALQGMKAEEWLMAGTTPFNVPGNVFRLEANTTSKSVLEPVVTLKMNTAWSNGFMQTLQTDKPSLTEGEAIGLWDAVSRTLRPRPNGF